MTNRWKSVIITKKDELPNMITLYDDDDDER
jgi:hypothetical protein